MSICEGGDGVFFNRRTFATLLKANGEDIKVAQELLRPTVKMTLEVYAQTVTPAKRRRSLGLQVCSKEDPNKSKLLLDILGPYSRSAKSSKLLEQLMDLIGIEPMTSSMHVTELTETRWYRPHSTPLITRQKRYYWTFFHLFDCQIPACLSQY